MIHNTKTGMKSYEIDMCNGPLFGKLLLFTLPLMISGILQLLFNAADMIVVGRWVGSDALAAVGSNGPLINLLVNVFLGLSVGTNVMIARFYGSGQKRELSEMVHTSLLTAFICGVFLIFLGFFVAPAALKAMGSPDEVLPQSVLYLRIYFFSMPAMMLYNFGSAILRAVGDTRRPLYYLTVAGVINIILNLTLVVGFSMGVAGVALATTVSQIVSAGLVLNCLMNTKEDYRLDIKSLRIVKSKLFAMARIGIPAGLQGAVFSVSNILIQSSINSFGATAMAANSAASNLEGFVYTSMNTLQQTSVSFVSQNYGARQYKRIGLISLQCVGMVTVIGLVMGNGMYLAGSLLLRLYSKEDAVITMGLQRIAYVCCFYFLCGVMDTLVGCIRGIGYSVLPMLVSLSGACLFRIIWIYTVFQEHRSLDTLYISYPISWVLTVMVHLACFLFLYARLRKKA